MNLTKEQEEAVVEIFEFSKKLLKTLDDVQGIILPYTNNLSSTISETEKSELASIVKDYNDVQFPLFEKMCKSVDLHFEILSTTFFDPLVTEFINNSRMYGYELLLLIKDIEPKTGLFSSQGTRKRFFESYYRNDRARREMIANMIYICTLAEGLNKINIDL